MTIYKFYSKIRNRKLKIENSDKGIILIELLIVLMIIGILITGAVKAWDVTIQQTKFTQTTKEINELCYAISGNPELYTEGSRTDFGYVADMGKIPDTLTDLVTPPVDSTNWHGPYIKNKFAENPNDYLQDAWGNYYIYNKDSLTITSYTTGSNLTPQTWIHRKIAQAESLLIRNIVTGRVLDLLGNPPGINDTFIRIYITYPYNGDLGIFPELGQKPNSNGEYTISNIPQGNHKMFVIYDITPSIPDTTDFIEKYVCIYPGIVNSVDFRLTQRF